MDLTQLDDYVKRGRELSKMGDGWKTHALFEAWDEDVGIWLDKIAPTSGLSAKWSALGGSRLDLESQRWPRAQLIAEFRSSVRERLGFLSALPVGVSEGNAELTPPGTSHLQRPTSFDYDVALSFAGEDRDYVRAIAETLQINGIRVFFDEFEASDLWGKDLYVYLSEIYFSRARYTILFASQHYARKAWPNHERGSAQARAFEENREYILPVRLDDTPIPGLLPTTSHISASKTTQAEIVRLVLKKLAQTEQTSRTTTPREGIKGSSLVMSRAIELAAQRKLAERREEFLGSAASVAVAKAAVRELFEYINTQVSSIAALHPGCRLSTEKKDGLILVKSSRKSFTVSWQMEFQNKARGAGLFIRELDGMHSIDSFGPKGSPTKEVDVLFSVDDELQAKWCEDDEARQSYTTQELADKYLSVVIEDLYAP